MLSSAVRFRSAHEDAKPMPVLSRSSSRSARRWFLIVAPLLAGLLAIVGASADPCGAPKLGHVLQRRRFAAGTVSCL